VRDMCTSCSFLIPTALFFLATATSAAIRDVGVGYTFSTVQACLSAATPGDVCNIHAGTYTEQLILPTSGTSTSFITLRNNGNDLVRIHSPSSPVLNLNGQRYWTISGIAFTYNGTGSAPRILSSSGNVDYVTIANCTLTLATGTGSGFGVHISNSDHLTITGTTIAITTPTGSHDGADLLFASNLHFSGNTIYGNASEVNGRLEDGLVVSGTHLNIQNNLLHDGWSYDSHPDAIVVQGDGDRNGNHTSNVVVQQNVIYNFTQGIYFDAIHNSLDGPNAIINNVVYETSSFRYGGVSAKMNCLVIDGESLTGPAWPISVTIANNTLDCRQLQAYVLRGAASGSNISFKNNLFIRPSFTAIYIASTSGVTIDYSYYSDSTSTPLKWGSTPYSLPAFTGAGLGEAHAASGSAGLNSDYSLDPTSDVVSRGVNLFSLFTQDRIGTIRPSTGNWDIGAYQLSSAEMHPLPPTALQTLVH